MLRRVGLPLAVIILTVVSFKAITRSAPPAEAGPGAVAMLLRPDAVPPPDTARRDSAFRDTSLHDRVPRDSVRRDSVRRDSLPRDTTHKPMPKPLPKKSTKPRR